MCYFTSSKNGNPSIYTLIGVTLEDNSKPIIESDFNIFTVYTSFDFSRSIVVICPTQFCLSRENMIVAPVCRLQREYVACRVSMSTAARVCRLPREYIECRASMSNAAQVCQLPRKYVKYRGSKSTAAEVCKLSREYVDCRKTILTATRECRLTC